MMNEQLSHLVYDSKPLNQLYDLLDELRIDDSIVVAAVDEILEANSRGKTHPTDNYDTALNHYLSRMRRAETALLESASEIDHYDKQKELQSSSVFIAYSSYLRAIHQYPEPEIDQLELSALSLMPGVPVIIGIDSRPMPAIIRESPKFNFNNVSAYYDIMKNVEEPYVTFIGEVQIHRPDGISFFKFNKEILENSAIGSATVNNYLGNLALMPNMLTVNQLQSIQSFLIKFYQPILSDPSELLMGKINNS